MNSSFIAGRFFLVIQLLIFFIVLIGLIIYRRRLRERANYINPEHIGKGTQVRRVFISDQKEEKESRPQTTAALLSTAFPSWNEFTSPHDILGVALGADEITIERAFRDRLKKYHPDRFANDGAQYQERAHRTILLLKDARDKLLGKKTNS